MAIFAAIVAALAIAGWAFVKADEMSGLGRNVSSTSLRHAHGKLVRVEAEGELPQKRPFKEKLLGSLPWVTLAALLAVGVAAIGFGISPLMSFSTSGAAALIIAAEACLRADKSKATFWSYLYALVGGVLLALCAWTLLDALLFGTLQEEARLTAYIFATDISFAIGSCLCMALLPEKATFVRTFEDGARRSIAVSTRSVAYRAYLDMMDPSSKED